MPQRARKHKPTLTLNKKHRGEDQQRASATRRGYDRQWQKVRRRKLRAKPICEHCEAQGRVTLADDVDHIQPVEDKPELRLDPDNLQSLCRSCHNAKTHGRTPTSTDGYSA